jgi:hypothetical protein
MYGAQYHLPFAKPPKAMRPTSVTMSPTKKLHDHQDDADDAPQTNPSCVATCTTFCRQGQCRMSRGPAARGRAGALPHQG